MSVFSFTFLAVLLCLSANLSSCFTVSRNANQLFTEKTSGVFTEQRIHEPSLTMYMPSSKSTSKKQPLVSQKMLKTVGVDQQRKSQMKLSGSVHSSASSDTLPQFKMANGLLSPETVFRMDEMTCGGSVGSEAVSNFLDTCRRHGPMSCLPMLSDPDVLPHLTAAMRDIA